MMEPELLDGDAWVAATDARREAIVQGLLAALPEFELACLKAYPGAEDSASEDLPALPPCPIATLRQRATGILFNLIPGGTFDMGFSERQARALQRETAGREMLHEEARLVEHLIAQAATEGTRRVHVHPFLLGRTTLSRSEVVQLLGKASEDEVAFTLEEVDVACFFAEDVDTFLEATGYRLPSEAEWEYACRAGSDGLFWWGDRIPSLRQWTAGWWDRLSSPALWTEEEDDDVEEDRYSNRFGLVNLGAYPEVCADLQHDKLAGGPTDGSAWIDNPDHPHRVTRGGAALDYPWQGVGEWADMLTSGRYANMEEVIRPVYPLPFYPLPA